jgi:soluble lytic murein transglycosylase-like protein
MAKSHPAQFDDQSSPYLAQWARNMVASFTLMACLISLSLILQSQYGARVTGAISQGWAALDPAHWVTLAEAAAQPAESRNVDGAKYRAVGDYLARRYRVSSEMTTSVVSKAYVIGAELKLDPLVILAVIAVESRFNPVAESVMGAKGLMQVIPRYHTDKFEPLGGEKVAFDLQANILVGAKILKEYLRRTGDLADALQLYVGASSDENENGYTGKVIAERDRLNVVVRQFQNQNRTAQHQPLAGPLAAAI